MTKGDSLRNLSVNPRDPISARSHNDLLRRVANLQAETVMPPRRGSGGTSVIKPFTMILTAQASPSTDFDLILWPGTVNQLVPSSMFTPITYDPTTTRYVKLRVSTDGYKPTSTSIVSEAGVTSAISEAADTAPTSLDILVGVIVTGTLYQVWQSGNVILTPSLVLTVGKAVPVPGTSPYTYYYTWGVSGDAP